MMNLFAQTPWNCIWPESTLKFYSCAFWNLSLIIFEHFVSTGYNVLVILKWKTIFHVRYDKYESSVVNIFEKLCLYWVRQWLENPIFQGFFVSNFCSTIIKKIFNYKICRALQKKTKMPGNEYCMGCRTFLIQLWE